MSETKRQLLYFCGDRGIPYGGTKGASIHIREFVETLLETHYSPTVLMSRTFHDIQSASGFPIYALNGEGAPNLFHEAAGRHGVDRSALREIDDFNRNQEFYAKLCELYDRNRFNIIYERYSLFSIAGLVFARQAKVPFVLEVNAPLVREASQYRSLYLLELSKQVENYLFSRADHIIAVSDPLKQYILNIAPKAKVSTIPNGVDLNRFNGRQESGQWRAKVTSNPEKDFVIGFVGSVKPWHGVELLIDALADVVASDRTFSLCLVGNADQVKEDLQLRAQARGLSDRLTILGAVPHEDVPGITSSFDVLVAPYPNLPEFYFSPLKIFEYMATGKPIVASRIGQISEILADGDTAILTEAGDRQSLCAALIRLKSDPQLRKRLGENAAEIARRDHSWHQRLSTVTTILDGLLDKKERSKEVLNAD